MKIDRIGHKTRKTNFRNGFAPSQDLQRTCSRRLEFNCLMAPSPEKIRSIRDASVLEIQWTGDNVRRYPFKFLRCECPCAACVNEFTGERILNPDSIPASVHPVNVGFSGNYALKIEWNDGHNTGIYTWELLQRLSTFPEVELIANP